MNLHFAKREEFRMDTKNWFVVFVCVLIGLPFFTPTTFGQAEVDEAEIGQTGRSRSIAPCHDPEN